MRCDSSGDHLERNHLLDRRFVLSQDDLGLEEFGILGITIVVELFIAWIWCKGVFSCGVKFWICINNLNVAHWGIMLSIELKMKNLIYGKDCNGGLLIGFFIKFVVNGLYKVYWGIILGVEP